MTPSTDGNDSPAQWYRIVRRTVTDETIYVQAASRTAAPKAAQVEYFGPYNPQHVKETIRSVSGPVAFDPDEAEA
jgi:hypothetical protein